MKMMILLSILAFAIQAYAETDDVAYNKKVFELGAILYGASEIGAKSCKPAGTIMPVSLSSWWSAVATYSKGETARDTLLNERLSALETKMTALSANLQVEAIQLQIDAVDASIESINGANGRIVLRENLLLAALASEEYNSKENVKTLEAYYGLVNTALNESYNIAKASCEKKKKSDCVEAMAKISLIITTTAPNYKTTYLTAPLSSLTINDKLQTYEEAMSGIPKSSDASFDWSAPIEAALTKLKNARLDSGVKCPSSSDKSSDAVTKAASSFMEKIGVSHLVAVSSTFIEAWDKVDQVIGQAGHRGEYFEYIIEKVNELLVMDREKLANLLETRAKLEVYLAEAKATMKATTTTILSGETTALGSDSSSSSLTAAATSASTVVSNSTNSEAATTLSAQSGSSATTSSAVATASTSSFSLISNLGSAAIATNSTGLSLSGKTLAIAKKSLTSISESDKKLSAVTTKASIADASKSTVAVTSLTPKTSTLKKSLEGSFGTLKKSVMSDYIYKAALLAGLKKTTFTVKSVAAVENSSDTTSALAGVSKSSAIKLPSADALSIAESITARKSKRKDEYEAKEDDSLFQIVTKAYIRNYEKVEGK